MKQKNKKTSCIDDNNGKMGGQQIEVTLRSLKCISRTVKWTKVFFPYYQPSTVECYVNVVYSKHTILADFQLKEIQKCFEQHLTASILQSASKE